jgi:RimJ/RimL family protein N-acetyltransferase
MTLGRQLVYKKLAIEDLQLFYHFFWQGLLPHQQRYFMPHPRNKVISFILYFCMILQQRFSRALYIVVLKEDELMPIGFILLRNFKKNRAELGVVVSFHYQGKGYGSILLDKIISIAEAMRMRELWLSYDPSNHQAKKLYSKFGFRECGEKKVMTLTFKMRKVKLMSLKLDT